MQQGNTLAEAFFFRNSLLLTIYIMKTLMNLDLVERQTLLKPVFHLIGCIVHLAVLLTSDEDREELLVIL